MPARLASMAALPFSLNRLSNSAETTSTSSPISRAAIPNAIMLGRPSGMAFAMSFTGSSRTCAPAAAIRGGVRRRAGSLITNALRAHFDLGAEAVALSQSIPIKRSNWSGRDSTG